MNNIIGKKVKRIDAYEKVTGKAIYGDDIKLIDMLYAAVRHTDIPGQQRLGSIRPDQYAIVENEVFFSGDVIAVVAAE